MTAYRIYQPGAERREGEPSFSEILAAYLADQESEVGKSTLADRARIGRRFADAFGESSPSSIRPSEVKAWILAQSEWTKPNTRWAALLILKRIFNWAVDDRWIPFNPIKKLTMPQGDSRRATSEAEFQVMLRSSDRAFRRLLIFLRLTGCRPGEAAMLEWGWIDWRQCLAVIPRDRHKTGAKTGKPRVIPLTSSAVKLLLAMQREALVASGPAFRNSRGNPWTRVAMGQRLKDIREATGLSKEATLHGVRHLVGTLIVKRTGNLRAAADVLGHAKTATTEKFYCHLMEDPAFIIGTAEAGARREVPKSTSVPSE